MGFREIVGDYQRQLFLVDHAGLPPAVALEQLEMLGTLVVPVLRREFAALKPAHVPEAPTHASLLAARDAAATAAPRARRRRGGTRARAGWRRSSRSDERAPPRRRLGGPEPAVVDPAARRPPRRRDRGRASSRRASTPRTETIELRDHARALADHLLTGFPSPELRATLDAVLAADGLIAVTPIFNASYSGLFKLFFDVLELDSLDGVPVLVAATGGTARHSLALDHALRPLFAYLGALVLPTGVYAASDDWGSAGDGAGLADRIRRAGGELAAAMAAHRGRRSSIRSTRRRTSPPSSATPQRDPARPDRHALTSAIA